MGGGPHSVCSEFSFMVSGGGGLDCTCIIWDLNTFAPVRSLDRMPGPVVAIAVSNTTVRCPVLNRSRRDGPWRRTGEA